MHRVLSLILRAPKWSPLPSKERSSDEMTQRAQTSPSDPPPIMRSSASTELLPALPRGWEWIRGSAWKGELVHVELPRRPAATRRRVLLPLTSATAAGSWLSASDSLRRAGRLVATILPTSGGWAPERRLLAHFPVAVVCSEQPLRVETHRFLFGSHQLESPQNSFLVP